METLWLRNLLDNNVYTANYIYSKNAIENSIAKDTEFEKKHTRSDKDTTKYSLNGSEFLPKRVFAHRVIKTFVEQHPDYTYEQLKEIFNDDILRPAWVCKGLLARVEDLLDGTISEKQIDINVLNKEDSYKAEQLVTSCREYDKNMYIRCRVLTTIFLLLGRRTSKKINDFIESIHLWKVKKGR